MYFEVLIPGRGQVPDATLQIEAGDWRKAAQVALQQIEPSTQSPPAFFALLRPDFVLATDPQTRRTLHVRPISEAQSQQGRVLKALTGKQPAIPQQVPRAAAAEPAERTSGGSTGRGLGYRDRTTGMFRPFGAAEIAAPQAASGATEQGQVRAVGAEPVRVLQETYAPALDPAEPAVAPVRAAQQNAGENALEEVFLEASRLFEVPMEEAIDLALELAMRHVDCEHGALLFAADPADHLYAAAAVGPHGGALVEHRFSISNGIAAASLRSGVALSLTNPSHDPRYTPDLRNLGITERSLLVAPIQHNNRAFGLLYLINRTGARDHFSPYDSNVVSYVGAEMGQRIQRELDALDD